MSRIAQPLNQKRLTNVCVVRYSKAGKRFELACYPNKVLDWRRKTETDIDEVLQAKMVFTNVSKGAFAASKDLLAAFGTDDHDQCALIILEKGEVQVTAKERQAEADSKLHDIATFVATKCVNKQTKRPFPVATIEAAMKDLHFSINPNRSAKQQALEVITLLSATIPIERAQMRIRIEVPLKVAKEVKKAIEPLVAAFESETFAANAVSILLLSPGNYREFEEKFMATTKGQGSMELMDHQVQVEGDADLGETNG